MGDQGTPAAPAAAVASAGKSNYFSKLSSGAYATKRPRLCTAVIVVFAIIIVVQHVRAHGIFGYGKKKASKAAMKASKKTAKAAEPETDSAGDSETDALIGAINKE